MSALYTIQQLIQLVTFRYLRQEHSETIRLIEEHISNTASTTTDSVGLALKDENSEKHNGWIQLMCIYGGSILKSTQKDKNKQFKQYLLDSYGGSIHEIPCSLFILLISMQLDTLKKARREIEEWLVLQSDAYYENLIRDREINGETFIEYCALIEIYLIKVLCVLKEQDSALEFLKTNEILKKDMKKKFSKKVQEYKEEEKTSLTDTYTETLKGKNRKENILKKVTQNKLVNAIHEPTGDKTAQHEEESLPSIYCRKNNEMASVNKNKNSNLKSNERKEDTHNNSDDNQLTSKNTAYSKLKQWILLHPKLIAILQTILPPFSLGLLVIFAQRLFAYWERKLRETNKSNSKLYYYLDRLMKTLRIAFSFI